jgi:CopG-like RHH_1 or ribbon-helix-helix domain, RHH_5
MSNFQIKGMDDDLYAELKKLASGEGRSLSQQAVFLFKDYLAGGRRRHDLRTPAQVLLDLAGSWEEKRGARTIVSKIKKARANSKRLRKGL